ncbi:MAG: hypothetical protein ACOY0T_40940 [Myxococcota bacterium]
MPNSQSKRIHREALLALFAGLSLANCQKTEPSATAEKPSEPARGVANAVASAQPAKPAVSAVEIPKPAGSAEKESGCAPGGCSPGACAGSKKK